MAGTAAVELKILISVLQDSVANLKNTAQDIQHVVDASQKLTNTAGATANASNEAGIAVGGAGKNAVTAAAGMEALERSMSGVMRGVRFLAGGFLALQSVRLLKDLADTAARTQVLGTVLQVIGSNAGYTKEYLDDLDKSVQSLGITASASRQSLVQMIQAGLDPSLAGGKSGLARAAQDLAVIGGINSSQAFERLITSIQRGYTEGLRYLGIVVRKEEAEQRYAASINKTVGQLSMLEKTTALTNEVLRKSAELTGTYEKAMSDVGKMISSLPRQTEELKEAVGKGLLPVYRALVIEYTTLLENLKTTFIAMRSQTTGAGELAIAVQRLAVIIRTTIGFIAKHSGAILDLVEAYLAFKAIILLISGAKYLLLLPIRIFAVTSAIGAKTASIWASILAWKASTTATAANTVATEAATAAQVGAAAGITATGTAATGTATSLSLLGAAWLKLAALMAVPIIGYAISRHLSEEGEELKKPLGVRWKNLEAAQPGYTAYASLDALGKRRAIFSDWLKQEKLPADTKFGEGEEFTRFEEAMEKEAKEAATRSKVYDTSLQIDELKKQSELVSELDIEYKKLQATDERRLNTADRALLEKERENVKEKLKLEQEKKNVLEQQIGNADLATVVAEEVIAANDARALAQGKLAVAKELPFSTKEEELAKNQAIAEAEAELAELTQKYKDLSKKFDLTARKANLTADQIAKMKVEAEKNAEKVRVERRKTNLEEKEQQQQQQWGFTKEGVVSKESEVAISFFRDEVGMLGELGDDFEQRMKRVKSKLDELGPSIKTKQDLKNLNDALGFYAERLGEIDKKNREAGKSSNLLAEALPKISQVRASGFLRNEQFEISKTADTINRARENFKNEEAEIQKSLAFRLNAIKTANAIAEIADNEFYKTGLMSLEEYYDQRKARITSEIDAELAIRQEALNRAERELKQFGGTGTGPQRVQLEQAVVEAQRQIDLLIGAAPTEKFPQGVLGEEQRRIQADILSRTVEEQSLRQQILQLEQQTAAFYGGEKEALDQIDEKYDQQLIKLHAIRRTEEEILSPLAQRAENAVNDQRFIEKMNVSLEFRNKRLQEGIALEKAMIDAARTTTDAKRSSLTQTEAMRQSNIQTAKEIALLEFQIAEKNKTLQAQSELVSEGMRKGYSSGEMDQLVASVRATMAELATMNAGVTSLISNIVTYGKELRKVFSESLAEAIAGSITDIKNAGEVWLNFSKRIRDNIVGVFSTEMAERITRTIVRATSRKDEQGKVIPNSSVFERIFEVFGLDTKTKNDGSSVQKALFVREVNPAKGEVSTSESYSLPGMGAFASIGQSFGLSQFSGVFDAVAALDKALSKPKVTAGSGTPLDLLAYLPSLGPMFGGHAEGGVISGPGTGTSDSIPAMVSNGEHIMPAEKTKTWLPLLESIRTGTIKYAMGGLVDLWRGMPSQMPSFAMGGVVGGVQSIAIPSVIPMRFASGGVVVTDGGASAVQPGKVSGDMTVRLAPEALNMTMRDWLEHEVVRQHSRR